MAIKNQCTGFSVDISFQLLYVNINECDYWIIWWGYVYFCKKLPNCGVTKWLCHFAFPPTINESSFCSTSSLVYICVLMILTVLIILISSWLTFILTSSFSNFYQFLWPAVNISSSMPIKNSYLKKPDVVSFLLFLTRLGLSISKLLYPIWEKRKKYNGY